MIVYGDPSYSATLCKGMLSLCERISRLHSETLPEQMPSNPQRQPPYIEIIDALRTLLIEAGQWEQAVMDALSEDATEFKRNLQMFAEKTASVFDAACHASSASEWREINAKLSALLPLLDAEDALLKTLVTVKLPEGFAFYTLYPERYALAAQQWTEGKTAENGVIVVGVRSIGTTLSALAAQSLRRLGWQMQRVTVRPTGHPLSRQVSLPADVSANVAWGLIVDEGPGISGSSMAAAAEALTVAGMPRDRISFLASHEGEPSEPPNESVRRRWADTPRYSVPLEAAFWQGLSLTETLAAQTERLCPNSGKAVWIESAGGGLWRKWLYANVEQWTAASVPFEATKYRCWLENGDSVLWKFAGLAVTQTGSQVDNAWVRMRRLAEQGWTVAPLGTTLGFVAIPWVEGTPLTSHNTDTDTLRHIGKYLALSVGSSLDADAQKEALERLSHLLYWNTWEALGEAAAEQTKAWTAKAAAQLDGKSLPSYGDGRLAPHEWLRTAEGRILKTDCAGHDQDHTIVGRQIQAWDVVGALVEWRLSAANALPLLAAYTEAGGRVPSTDVLRFYQMAYAAFRVGMMAVSANAIAHDPTDQARCWHAYHRYKTILKDLLEEEFPTAQ